VLILAIKDQVILVVPSVLYPGIPTLGPSILAPARRAGQSEESLRAVYAPLTILKLMVAWAKFETHCAATITSRLASSPSARAADS